MSKVSKEVAEKEVSSWLDYKKISDKKKEGFKENIESMVDAICDGVLTLEADFTLTHHLKFPIESEVKTTELKYKPRLKMVDVHKQLAGVEAKNVDGRVVAYIAALTDKPKRVITELESEDYGIAQSVAVFFL